MLALRVLGQMLQDLCRHSCCNLRKQRQVSTIQAEQLRLGIVSTALFYHPRSPPSLSFNLAIRVATVETLLLTERGTRTDRRGEAL